MNPDPTAPLGVIRAQPPDPGDERGDIVWPLANRDGAPEVDQRMTARFPLPVPGPPSADRKLDLGHRREPVDRGSLEQPDFHDAHGPGRIARR